MPLVRVAVGAKGTMADNKFPSSAPHKQKPNPFASLAKEPPASDAHWEQGLLVWPYVAGVSES
jgi:hypothetical protein